MVRSLIEMKNNIRILVVDNYDSFTYNLVDYLMADSRTVVEVFRNDDERINQALEFDGIVLSPGPGLPKEAGLMPELIKMVLGTVPIFGICLGHQAIVESLGGSLLQLKKVKHGVSSELRIEIEDPLFVDVNDQTQVGRYHSWVVNKSDLPKDIEVLATDEEGTVMAYKNQNLQCYGVQFHPESIMTPEGMLIIRNWLDIVQHAKNEREG